MEDKWVVDKLDGSNWITWKFQLKHLLLGKGLWKYVDGSAVLAEDATEEQRAKHQNESQRAFSVIAMAVSTSQLYLITSYEEPKEAWDALKKHFERETLANKLFLKKRYFRKEMSECTSIEMHLKEMKELTDKLSSIGAPISEEDCVVTLLGSLPSSFSSVVTALEARVDDLTLDFVQQQLIHHERKIKDHELKPEATTDSALVGAQKWKSPKCWFCDEVGHIQRFCPKRKKSQHRAKVMEDEIESVSDDEGAFPVSDEVHGDKWLIDSGASSHMTYRREYFTKYQPFTIPERVSLGDGRVVEAVGVGTIQLSMLFKVSTSKRAVMYDVLHVPKLACNLFSVRAAAKKGNTVKFGQSRCWISGPKGTLKGMGFACGKLYHLKCKVLFAEENASVAENLSDTDLWHQRLGHLNSQQLCTVVSRELAHGIKLSTTSKLSFCEGCVEGKMQRKPFKSLTYQQSRRKLELIHSDICGPFQVESIGGSRYFVTFVDDYAKYISVHFIKNKSEAFEKFKLFEAMVSKECDDSIVKLRTDNGGEYLSKDFQAYLASKGIEHQLTIPHSPQQNGVAERLNRTLMESARAMLSHSKLPNKFWAEAVATAAYVRNRTTTTSNQDQLTPFEKWYGRKPNIAHLKVFGCAAYSHVPSAERRKLDKKAHRMCFIGYSKNPKGYRLIDPSTEKVVTRRDVVFNETDFKLFSRKNTEMVCIPDEFSTESEEELIGNEPEAVEPRRSQRTIRRPDYYGFLETGDVAVNDEYINFTTTPDHCAYTVQEIPEPKTFEEATRSPHAKEWRNATDLEYQSLIDNDTWDLVELPEEKSAVGCKWVFKVKYNGQGKIERFKSRLVAKGYSQRHGIDFEETFSPVVRYSSIRTLLAHAVQKDMIVHQMDVITAFLHGKLNEELYMQQPEGYEVSGKENLVCRLKKSLYGLKQASRCWNQALNEFMVQAGFVQSNADPCVFTRFEDHTTIVAVYVDDLIIFTDIIDDMTETKSLLSKQFKMKDMGQLHYFLGVNVIYGQNCVWLHQNQYIKSMLQKFALTDANTVSTPADCSVTLVKDDQVSKSVNQVEYQSMVGSLLYVAMMTRPDIAQAVATVSKFCSNPTEAHKTAVKRIFRYLKKTLNLALKYCKDEKLIIGFSDADWGGDRDDRHSTTGNVFVLAGGAVSWLSKKQAVVALSTCEAEYVALSTAGQEAVWFQKLFGDLRVSARSIVIKEDNQGAIALSRNPTAHSRTKHIDIRFHFIRKAHEDGIVDITYCPTSEMVADLLTKPIPRVQFEKLRACMGIKELKY